MPREAMERSAIRMTCRKELKAGMTCRVGEPFDALPEIGEA